MEYSQLEKREFSLNVPILVITLTHIEQNGLNLGSKKVFSTNFGLF
jgi:hypothetical protein